MTNCILKPMEGVVKKSITDKNKKMKKSFSFLITFFMILMISNVAVSSHIKAINALSFKEEDKLLKS